MLQGHPYIPNAVPSVERKMLERVGIEGFNDLYSHIPADLRMDALLDLPGAILAEMELKKHVGDILSTNVPATGGSLTSYLGGDCYDHYVPAVCDEINSRNEFLTSYSGRTYEDHGRLQALWQYASMMGDLLEMDVVSLPAYDGYQAASTSIRMAASMTGRSRVLIAETISPDKLSTIREYNGNALTIELVRYDPDTAAIDWRHLADLLDQDVACVYFDQPGYFGTFEADPSTVIQAAQDVGALSVIGIDPILLGVVAPPAQYGADIVCGDIQALGMHMQFGGGQAGFIATRDEARFVEQFPIRLSSLTTTGYPGEWGFGEVLFERTSFAQRELGREWIGTTANLWGITAGVFLALHGPKGMSELGDLILSNARFAAQKIGEIPGVISPRFHAPHGKEFVVDFSDTGLTFAQISAALLERDILAGIDLEADFGLQGCALLCVTEKHTRHDIERLVKAIREVVAQ
jgi:glycine dehydrogenase subunit 1